MTLFELIYVLLVLGGGIGGGYLGCKHFGVLGCIVGSVIGLCVVPFSCWLLEHSVDACARWQLRRMSTDQLISRYGRSSFFFGTADIREQLARREYDDRGLLLLILSHLDSDDPELRRGASSALKSDFSEFARMIPAYNWSEPPEVCREKCLPLREAIEQIHGPDAMQEPRT